MTTTIKRGLKFLALAGLLCLIALLALPKFLSSSFVKDAVSAQLSALTGRPVTLQGESSVSLRPYLSVIYRDVQVADTTPGAPTPLVRVDELQAELSILSAIWGSARIAKVHLIRPEFYLRINRKGEANFALTQGPLAERLAIAEGQPLDNIALGSISVEEARIAYFDERSRTGTQEPLLDATAVNGSFNWPSLSDGATAIGVGIVRGEIVEVDAQFSQMFEFLRSGSSDISTTITSAALKASFDGSANWRDRTLNGNITANATAVPRLVKWLEGPLPAKPLPTNHLPNAFNLTASIQAAAERIEFSDGRFQFNDYLGTGRLLITHNDDKRYKLGGTLAFDTLTMPSLEAIVVSENGAELEDANDADLMGFDIDLSISANQASIPPFQMDNLAAAVFVRDGDASFDIGQADILGGQLSGSLNYSHFMGNHRVKTRLNIQEMNMEALAQLYETSHIFIEGTGDAQVNLKTSGADFDTMMRHLNGEVMASATTGALKGIDLVSIAASQMDGTEDSSVLQNLGGETPFETFALNIFVANGTAFFNGSRLASPLLEATLGGRADVTSGSLAMRGVLKRQNEEEILSPIPFFIGGSTSTPLFVPLEQAKARPAKPRTEEKEDGPATQ